MMRVFIGYDSREAVAFNVLAHSIHKRASAPVSIIPVMLSQLKGVFTRERDPKQSTDFAFSRFLVPYLSGFDGWSLFIDCDMLMLADIMHLWALRDPRYAVQCVKHDHRPRETRKFFNAVQSGYERKNWSSVMLFNNPRCSQLTPGYVNYASGLELHQFKWIEDELIGELPHRWNHLVGYDPPREDVALAHYTLGGPYIGPYENCEYSEHWFAEFDEMSARR